MTQTGENVRVRRTRKLLRDALIELIEERGFERVTVRAITDRALVSRAAFYRNYNDKFHLVEQIFDDAMAALLGTLADDQAEPPAAERWVGFFEHIDRYHRFYGAMLGRRGSTRFAMRMRGALSEMVEEHIPATRDGTDGLPGAVLGAMLLQSITWWLENDRPIPPRQIAARSGDLAGAVISVANGRTTTR